MKKLEKKIARLRKLASLLNKRIVRIAVSSCVAYLTWYLLFNLGVIYDLGPASWIVIGPFACYADWFLVYKLWKYNNKIELTEKQMDKVKRQEQEKGEDYFTMSLNKTKKTLKEKYM